MEQLKIKNLFEDLGQTQAKELLESVEYPWEVLAGIGDFILKLGETLSEEDQEIADQINRRTEFQVTSIDFQTF